MTDALTSNNHHQWSSVVSRGRAKASACRIQVSLSCAVLCQIASLQYLSRSSLHRLADLHCRLFLSYGIQVMTREVHRSSLHRLVCLVPARYVRQSQMCPQLDMYDKNERNTQDMSDKARCVRKNLHKIARYVRQMCRQK